MLFIFVEAFYFLLMYKGQVSSIAGIMEELYWNLIAILENTL